MVKALVANAADRRGPGGGLMTATIGDLAPERDFEDISMRAFLVENLATGRENGSFVFSLWRIK